MRQHNVQGLYSSINCPPSSCVRRCKFSSLSSSKSYSCISKPPNNCQAWWQSSACLSAALSFGSAAFILGRCLLLCLSCCRAGGCAGVAHTSHIRFSYRCAEYQLYRNSAECAQLPSVSESCRTSTRLCGGLVSFRCVGCSSCGTVSGCVADCMCRWRRRAAGYSCATMTGEED
jgi:hypothetical protein